MYARFLCSRAHYAAGRPSARATIGYLVYKLGGGLAAFRPSARANKGVLYTMSLDVA